MMGLTEGQNSFAIGLAV